MRKEKATLIDSGKAYKAHQKLMALTNATCRRLMVQLDSVGYSTPSKLAVMIDREQPFVSLRLADLRRSGFATTRRDGKQIHYSLHYDNIDKANEQVKRWLAAVENNIEE